MTARTHARYLASSAWSHLRPTRPFVPREDRIRLGGGIILAAVVGAFVYRINPAGAVMLNVGSFLGALLCLLPRHHSRAAGVTAGLLLVDGGAAVGILLADHRPIAFGLLAIGLFAAGLARAVSVGAFMRLLLASIAMSAAGEMAGPLAHPEQAWLALGVFAVGQLIVALCGCVAHPDRAFAGQREAVAELYRQLLALAEGSDGRVMRARILARESVELIPLLEFAEARWIRQLLDAADEIAANLAVGPRPDDRRALEWILGVLAADPVPTLPDDLDLSSGVSMAVETVGSSTRSAARRPYLRNLPPVNTAGFYLRELRDVRGSTFRFALRVTLTGVLCQLVSEYLIADLGPGLPFHGFWTLLAGCLMVMPDYHGTSGKAIARTGGSILGALVGTALSLVPGTQHEGPFLVIAALFVLAYLVGRTMSQGTLMLVVVAWLAFILGGEPAAFTRTLDTIVGAVIAWAAFFVIPTWNVDRVRELFQQWCGRGRSALTTIAAESQSPGAAASRTQQRAFTDMLHSERRFVRAARVVPLEPRSEESPWPLESLPLISHCLDRVAVSLLQLQRSADAPGSGPAADPEAIEPFAEAFSALAEGGAAPVPEPPPGALHSLWRELRELERLTVD
ncbi:FUSC family protein [Tomitella gaofuii]|uniref:FUSC family protein n=1 Tax=Tomitella gaofuii TaxID=2760083 RepID=UPI0015FB6A1D|nr:FUSC family protein [Tomitella gaofuii]